MDQWMVFASAPQTGNWPPNSESFLAGIGALAGLARLIVGVSPDWGTNMREPSFDTWTSARSPTGAMRIASAGAGCGDSGTLKPVTRTWLRESVPSQRSDTSPSPGL